MSDAAADRLHRGLALPPEGSRCQETSIHHSPLPCGAPAEYLVRNRDPLPYAMCTPCADHNVRNRGARYVTADEMPVQVWNDGKILGLERYAQSRDPNAEGAGSLPAATEESEDSRQDTPPEHPTSGKPKVQVSAEFRDWAVAAIGRYAAVVNRETEPLLRGDLTAAETAAVYRDLRAVSEAIEEALEPLSEAVVKLNTEEVARAFEREGVKTLTIEGPDGTYRQRITISAKVRASIIPEARGQAYGWLRNNNLGALISETVNAETLSAAVRHRLENGEDELPDDMFRQYYQTTTSITKVTGESKSSRRSKK